MPRIVILCMLSMFWLASCGGPITITISGGPGAGAGVSRQAALPRGYERFLSPGSHNMRFSGQGEPVRRGAISERFELRDGDCAESDCAGGRLRAEIRESDTANTAKVGKDIWYGWSFYNENIDSVTRDRALGLVIGQWKLGGDAPPAFRIVQTAQGELNWAACDPSICNPAGTADEDVVAELENMRVAGAWGPAQNYGDVCRLFSMAQTKGQWVDIVVNTNFAADQDGYLRIWVNGVLRCNYYGQMVSGTGFGLNGRPLNHRRGLFASYPKPWRDNQGAAPVPTLIAYYDEFRSGTKRADVDPAARETAGAAAKD